MRALILWTCALAFALGLIGCNDPLTKQSPDRPTPSPTAGTGRDSGNGETPTVVSTEGDIDWNCLTQRVPVFMYHDVLIERPKKGGVYFDVTVEDFEKQMALAAAEGFVTITLDELYEHLTTGKTVPTKCMVLTFDDNYQGVMDNAIPVLRKYGFKASVFVHTKYVGNVTQGRPKMTYETLKSLLDEGIIQVEGHTVTHPADMKLLTEDQQRYELEQSKKDLESNLGIKVDYLAYPVGMNDETTRRLTKELGYKMAFTMKAEFAEGSPDIWRVNRFEQSKFEKVIEQTKEDLEKAPLGYSTLPMKDAPIKFEFGTFGKCDLVLLRGGMPQTFLSDSRQSVGDFVSQAGGVAGINGTFFNMAAITATDNGLIGPSLVSNKPDFRIDDQEYRLPKLRNRPVVMWNDSKVIIVPFLAAGMNDETPYKLHMPDVKNLFMAGCWIVKDGVARTKDQMVPFASQDIMDFRRRAFFGFTESGEIICGASKGSVTTEMLAEAAQLAGAKEAVLLDSGFSTSVVFDGKVLATGHSSLDHASRPVPHAIVLMGTKDPTADVTKVTADDGSQGQGSDPTRRRRRRRDR